MKPPRLRTCTDCLCVTRPTASKPADFEVRTVRRYGERCVNCYRRANGGQGNGRFKVAPETAAPLENTIAGLENYLRRRRERENAMARRAYYEQRTSA